MHWHPHTTHTDDTQPPPANNTAKDVHLSLNINIQGLPNGAAVTNKVESSSGKIGTEVKIQSTKIAAKAPTTLHTQHAASRTRDVQEAPSHARAPHTSRQVTAAPRTHDFQEASTHESTTQTSRQAQNERAREASVDYAGIEREHVQQEQEQKQREDTARRAHTHTPEIIPEDALYPPMQGRNIPEPSQVRSVPESNSRSTFTTRRMMPKRGQVLHQPYPYLNDGVARVPPPGPGDPNIWTGPSWM
jgi:hypothetical protein